MEDTAIIHGVDPHANKGAGAVEGHIVHDHAMEAAQGTAVTILQDGVLARAHA